MAKKALVPKLTLNNLGTGAAPAAPLPLSTLESVTQTVAPNAIQAAPPTAPPPGAPAAPQTGTVIDANTNMVPASQQPQTTTTTQTPTGTDQFGLPTYLNLPADIASGVNNLLHPDFSESDQRAAEQAVAGGFGGSEFADINNLHLRDSEKTARLQQAANILEPYQQRAQAQNLQTQQLLATHQEDVLKGQQALQQIQASDAGAMARLTAQEKAALERQVLTGQQALQQINAQGGLQLQLQDKNLAAQMAQLDKKLASDLQLASLANQGANYRAGLGLQSRSQPEPPTTTTGNQFDANATQSAINRILQQYGLSATGGPTTQPQDPWAALQATFNAGAPAAPGSDFGGDFGGSLGYTGGNDFAGAFQTPDQTDFGGSLYYTGGAPAAGFEGVMSPEQYYAFE